MPASAAPDSAAIGQSPSLPKSAFSRRSVRRLVGGRDFGLLVAIGVLLVVIAFKRPLYFRVDNLKVLGLQLSFVALPAVGMSLLMIGGYIDLSIGSVFSLTSVLGVKWALHFGFGVTFVLIVFLSAAIGLLNGYLVWRLSLSPLIVTLAGLTFYQGVINLISSGQGETDLSEGFTKYGQGAALFGLPNPVTIMIVIAVVAGFYLSKTSGGLNIYAVGGNVRAAGLAGVKTRRLVLCLFMVNVVIVGVAGLLNASRFGGAVPSQGVGLELSVITAVVLGGVSLTGGEGSILGTVLAAVLLTVVSSGIVVLAVNVYWSDIVRGLLLFAAVAIDQITKEQHERYRRAQAMKAAIGDGAGEA